MTEQHAKTPTNNPSHDNFISKYLVNYTVDMFEHQAD